MYFRMGGRNEKERYALQFTTVQHYLIEKCKGNKASSFFHNHNLRKIVLFGKTVLGECLQSDLADSDIQILGKVDKCNSMDEIKNMIKNADAVVLVDLFELNNDIDFLLENNLCQLQSIMNINDVIYNM